MGSGPSPPTSIALGSTVGPANTKYPHSRGLTYNKVSSVYLNYLRQV